MKNLALIFCLLLSWSAVAKGVVKLTVLTPANTPKESQLSLGGDFNGWNPSATSHQLTATGRHSYVFEFPPLAKGTVLNFKVTRGDWASVEIAKNGANVENRRILISEDIQHETLVVAQWADLNNTPAPSTITGEVLFEDVELPTFPGTRKLRIYLPPDYSSSNKRYPVIYMTDGQNLFDQKTANSGEWQMDELMEKLAAQDSSLTSIIVGIDHAGSNRRAEYLPFNFVPKLWERTFTQPLEGKGQQFADWLVNELKPNIDRRFRTRPQRQHTTIMGSSMGGLISCYTGLRHQQVFSKVGCYSSAFLKRLVSDNLLNFIKSSTKRLPMRIHIDMGDNEFGLFGENILNETEEVYNALRAIGFGENEIRYQVIVGGTHDEPSWRERTLDILNWLNH